ncbi:hypothetical protein Dsin_031934 [Dipteronia sinensis]|uniref:Formin-like protein n=1 Tax=Dipteronia sinensis TaxID=43782 RepID=A0AAD9ZMW7_9ROSI|nr:hypothetical protein Dsin_031934 [Dipteronia sinensis]
MLCFFFFFFFFLILTYAPHQLTCTSIANRRILHQPFFPLNSLPPSQPPSLPPPSPPPSPSPPTNPKFPFSSSSSNSGSTPNQSPFFPSYPVSPPPPGPATFASFPANISSLILPHSTNKPKPNSQKLLILALASVLSAVTVAGILVFLYCRKRRRKSFIDQKDSYYSQNGETTTRSSSNNNISATTSQKLRATRTSSSSEFLYLGTLVNSRSGAIGDDGSGGDATVITNSNSHVNCESPELRPLPPLLLTHQASFKENPGNAAMAVSSAAAGEESEEEEDEEFYSPRVSLGSGSRREFATTTVASAASLENDVDGGGRRNSVSSSCSCSSTSSRSLSASISPPASPSPIRSDPKSSDTALEQHPPQSVFAMLSPLQSSPDHHRNIRSPSLSIASTSPDITLSPRTYNVFNRNVLSSSTTASTTPDREYMTTQNINLEKKNPDVSSKMSSISSSASTSPDRELEMLEKNLDDEVSKRLNLLDANAVGSPVLVSVSASSSPEKEKSPDVSPRSSLSSASTSPERDSKKSQNASPRITNVSNQSRQQSSLSSSPVRSSDASPRISITSPVRLNDALEQPISALAPPPPPPPPPPALSRPTRRQWEIPVVTTHIGQPISQPPPLIPPSKPFVIQNPTKVSPVELTSSSNTLESVEEEALKPKLKPLHWDKVRASSDREMVWDHLRSSSFKLNEEMIETLFVVNTPNTKPNQATPRPVLPSPNQDNRVLDPKKAQNIAILLRALHVTIEEVCEALLEGNADTLGTELLESLLKMAPSKEEERKLKDYKDDSPVKLCSAEKFLKAVLDVPFAFKRVDAMLYITNFESEVEYLKKSFETLEAACEELRNSRMFLKLLEAVLKTGNRMNVGTNRGDAHAFKLDTLLKLVDVKGADGKTTLLHFVVQEMIRTEGARLSNQNPNSSSTEDAKCRKLGLQVVSGLSSELTNVKKAAAMDSDVLSSDVSKLSKGLGNISEVVRLNETLGLDDSTKKFSESMNRFLRMAEEDMIRIQALESVALSLVKEITEYFHGNSAKEEAHPFRIFLVVRDFVTTLDRVCKEVGMINERTIISSAHKFPVPVNPMLQAAFTGSQERRQYSSSDDESASH